MVLDGYLVGYLVKSSKVNAGTQTSIFLGHKETRSSRGSRRTDVFPGSMPPPHIPPWFSAAEVTEHRSVHSPHGLEEGERHIGG